MNVCCLSMSRDSTDQNLGAITSTPKWPNCLPPTHNNDIDEKKILKTKKGVHCIRAKQNQCKYMYALCILLCIKIF